MATAAVNTATASKPSLSFEEKIRKLREIYADAGDISKTALENVIRSLGSAEPGNSPEEKNGKRRSNWCAAKARSRS